MANQPDSGITDIEVKFLVSHGRLSAEEGQKFLAAAQKNDGVIPATMLDPRPRNFAVEDPSRQAFNRLMFTLDQLDN